MQRTPLLIPVAGGKGGIGKSLITANLGIALAKMGYSVTAVDLDLGGSNLHTCLGLPNRFPGLGDYIKTPSLRFQDLIYDTEWDKLKFIPGDGRTPFMANITYSQKLDLLKHLKELNTEYVLLDLGAGTSFNTLDFYRISSHGLVVATPEKHALMNMLTFLKNVVYRAIDRAIIKRWDARELFEQACARPITREQITIKELVLKTREKDPEAAQQIEEVCSKYRPRLVLNMAEHPSELKLLIEANRALQNILSIECDFFGFIFQDDKVRKSMVEGVPLLKRYPDSVAGANLTLLAEDMVKWWKKSLKNTDQWLMKQTTHHYDVRMGNQPTHQEPKKGVFNRFFEK